MIPEPLELEILAAHLQKLGHDVDVVDLVLERRRLRWFVTQQHYDLVGLTGYINHVQVIKQLARDVKRVSPQTQVVVGGIHAEAVPTAFIDPSLAHIVWANGAMTIGELRRRGRLPAGRVGLRQGQTSRRPPPRAAAGPYDHGQVQEQVHLHPSRAQRDAAHLVRMRGALRDRPPLGP